MIVFIFKVSIVFLLRFVVILITVYLLTQDTGMNNVLSEKNNPKVGIFTAYTASTAETDSTPTVTANNQEVRKGIVANNCLPFGSRIVVNTEIYEIQDRMNARYGCDNFDIFMWDYSDAINFGRQELHYEII